MHTITIEKQTNKTHYCLVNRNTQVRVFSGSRRECEKKLVNYYGGFHPEFEDIPRLEPRKEKN